MQIILLEKIANVGNLGDVVKVKNGFARNYLIPQGKAKRATPDNLKLIEAKRAGAGSRRGCQACGATSRGGEARRPVGAHLAEGGLWTAASSAR